ncbi:hypothetical protein K432DRAFT_77345 [Lepidopterella palustris CBS 459.81]|uniref:C2H2-type domain-containing protein n=1 Tax=Lepidopterella palustris CBS 459.81 TaxID=1314670 RepID=A0A8E2JJR0_9PEZI|nr:hypothetical protein K432DRAFT_77345 [Lepidopterella palustris CBS 459.81]
MHFVLFLFHSRFQSPQLHCSGTNHRPFSELSFDESPVGTFSFFNPLDVALWSQSVSGTPISGKDLFFVSQDLQDMAGHIPEPYPAKDDDISVSSMGDSAYQSQPDATQRGTGANEGFQTTSPQETRGQMHDPFLGTNLYSPALSSDGHGGFHGAQSDMNQMLLPPSVGDSDLEESTFRMSDFANHSAGQGYGQFHGSAIPRFFTPASEIDVTQNWESTDVQTFTAPFAVRGLDANNFLPFRQQPQMNRDNTFPPQFYTPYMSTSQDLGNFFGNQMNQPQRRSTLPRAQLDTSSISGPESMNSLTPKSASQRERSASGADQVFKTFLSSTAMSPTSSILGIPRPGSVAESDFTEQSALFAEPSKMDKEEPVTSSIAPQSVKDDEFEDEPLSPSHSSTGQNSLEEAEGKLARTHPLYQAQPGDDDLYHCPNEGEAGCTHKPTKLKCNYDKYVDSHLRPFRCKVQSCVGVQFSSTACLLRHEREAHGMHGHGSKPHLCTYPDCERSMPGNGFPRRYNLFDHMKRVHDYTGSTSPPEQVSPAIPAAQTTLKRQNSSRKRKTIPVEEATEKRQRTTTAKVSSAATAAATEQHRLAHQKKSLQSEWSERRAAVLIGLENLQGPQDMNSHLQVSEDIAALNKIAARLNELG